MTAPAPRNEPPQTWTSLIRAIREGRGVYKTSIVVLRDINGAGRTGTRVMEEITGRLDEYGVSFLPKPMPTRQDDEVVLYERATYFGEIMRALDKGVSGAEGDALIDIARQVNKLADTDRIVPVDRDDLEGTVVLLERLQRLLA